MHSLIVNIQHLLTRITNINNSITDKILYIITQINAYCFMISIIFFYTVGAIVNHFVRFPKFIVFQSLFMGILVIAFFSIRYFEKQMKEIHRLMAGDKTLFFISDKIYRLRHSALNLIVPPAAGAFFGCLASLLFNINLRSLSSMYLIMIYTGCVLVSFLGYLQYIYLFIYIQKLSNNTKKISALNHDYPPNTKWVVLLTKLYSNYRSIFFLLGAAYVFGVIYFVLCGDYKVIEKITAYKEYRNLLIVFWGSVFLAIVIFFPISTVIEYYNIKKIVENLKNQSIIELNSMMPAHSITDEIKLQKSSLVIAIINTPDYPIKDNLAIVFSAFISFVNLAASIVAIIEFAGT